MKTTTQSDDPAKRPQSAPERGAPTPHAADVVKENLAVRLTVVATTAESDELREHGYGHGV